jgi:phosphoribosyl 1,2-cyclic phosphodiesterase
MKFYVLASGSKGNATLVISKKTKILLDAGLSKRKLIDALSHTSVRFEEIDFVLFSHEHGDHTLGASIFPIEKRYSMEGTVELIEKNKLQHYTAKRLKDFLVTPIPMSHDAVDPIGFVVDDGTQKLVYITDTGYISEQNLNVCKNADYFIVESNHNIKMLLQTDREFRLIQRILGDNGHLSNEDAALYISQMIGENTKEIVLAHLSEEANNPNVALDTFKRIISKRYIDIENIKVITAKQYEVVFGGQ